MKKTITAAAFFIMGYFGILFINYMSIEHPIAILFNGESNLEAFIEEWDLSALYNLSKVFAVLGILLFLIEPIKYLYARINQISK